MVGKMIIQKIRIQNFRGFVEKTFIFNDKSIVLLSAANGVGKTTIVDAIEWCLTGNIGRLKQSFDARSNNDVERKMNTGGILKNRNAGKKDEVVVTLWLLGEKQTILQRKQTKDVLDTDASQVTIEGSEEEANKFIKDYVGKSFYNYHFCDVQKSFNIQSTQRKDLNDLFSEFITNYDEEKCIANNLEIFAKDVRRYIDDKKNQKVKKDKIDELEKNLSEKSKNTEQIPYPEMIFFPGERSDIIALNKEELEAQKSNLYNYGYQVAEEKLSVLVKSESSKKKKSIIKNIVFYWETMSDSIEKAKGKGLLNNSDEITKLEQRHKRIKDLSLNKDTIIQDGEYLKGLEKEGFAKEDYESDKKIIFDKEQSVKNLKDEIDLLSKNNKILLLLANLATNKQEIIDFREKLLKDGDAAKCPLCGSDNFSTIDKNEILREADNYIEQNGALVKKKEDEKKLLQAEIDKTYEQLISRAKAMVQKESLAIEKEINSLKELKNEIQPYIDEVNKLKKSINTISVETLTKDIAQELLKTVENDIIEESKEKTLLVEYQQILTVIGYTYNDETIAQTYERIRNLIKNPFDVSNYLYDIFVSKINAISIILSNQEVLELRKKIDDCKKKNADLDKEINELSIIEKKAINKSEEINKIIEQLKVDEYKKVGPTLNKFYNKLARFNYRDGINISQQDEGISIVDNNNKNIVNVLSNGQISVFMLAHFFAGMTVRTKQEKMKIYFIDDLTACMDDVNMLAFMDLLKYQMSTKATMEQLFFATCDDRISELFKYKMKGRGIEICELREADFEES